MDNEFFSATIYSVRNEQKRAHDVTAGITFKPQPNMSMMKLNQMIVELQALRLEMGER